MTLTVLLALQFSVIQAIAIGRFGSIGILGGRLVWVVVCVRALPETARMTGLSAAAQAYLQKQGITSAATWTAFRLSEVTDADLHRLLTMPQRRLPRQTGCWLPTFDPRQPAQSIGLIRLAQAQNKHSFTTPPLGLAGPADLDQRASAIRRLQNAQRLLIPRPVAIPDLGNITLPAALARSRLHHDTLVGLIQASALLHQHQRPTVEGCVVATGADTEIAVRLLHHVAALQSGGMSRQAHRMLTTLWAGQRARFTMDDLDVLLPGWTRWGYRAALDELVALDFVAAGRGGRGKRREYALVATAPVSSALRLPAAGSAAELEVAHG